VSARSLVRSGRARLLLLSLCVAFAFQGSRGLYETTEGRYAEVGREMVAAGDWMTPRLDGRPHWTKPPLAYWSIAASLEIVGRNTWAARVPGAAALVAATMGVALLGAAMWDALTGQLAALIFLTCPFVVAGANVVSPDMLLAGWEVLAVLCFWRAVRATTPRAERGWIVLMWAAFGLAFLTKGTPGLLPLAAILGFGAVQRRQGTRMPRITSAAGLGAFVLIGLGWYLASIARHPGLAGHLLRDEVWGRVATGMHHRNARWFMPAVVFGVPLTLGLGAWAVTACVDARRFLRLTSWSDAMRGSEARFLLWWFALPLLVFCFSRSRLPLYVLPLAAPTALALARLSIRARGGERAAHRVRVVAAASVLVLVAAKGVAALIDSPHDMRPVADAIRAVDADRVSVLDEPGLHGLQFYLDGGMHRVSSAELRGELEAAGQRLSQHADTRELIVSRRGMPPVLERACADALACSTSRVGAYQLRVLRPRP
jgi:4-amino-4-deoxy-L-arabinose transferase